MRMGDFWLSDAPLTEKERELLAKLPPSKEEITQGPPRLLEKQTTGGPVIDTLCHRESREA